MDGRICNGHPQLWQSAYSHTPFLHFVPAMSMQFLLLSKVLSEAVFPWYVLQYFLFCFLLLVPINPDLHVLYCGILLLPFRLDFRPLLLLLSFTFAWLEFSNI
jgi:hypothetical protein